MAPIARIVGAERRLPGVGGRRGGGGRVRLAERFLAMRGIALARRASIQSSDRRSVGGVASGGWGGVRASVRAAVHRRRSWPWLPSRGPSGSGGSSRSGCLEGQVASTMRVGLWRHRASTVELADQRAPPRPLAVIARQASGAYRASPTRGSAAWSRSRSSRRHAVDGCVTLDGPGPSPAGSGSSAAQALGDDPVADLVERDFVGVWAASWRTRSSR